MGTSSLPIPMLCFAHPEVEQILFRIQLAETNPFKKAFQAFKYSWKHKVPVRQSALSYWEDDVPAHLDVGKLGEVQREYSKGAHCLLH